MDGSTNYKKEVVYVDDDNQPHVKRQQRVIHDQDAERRIGVSKIANLIWLVFGLLDMLLVFRFILKLIGANPANQFADFVYDLSAIFVKPFQSLIESPTSDDMVLEISVLVAIVVYSLLAWVLVRLVWLLLYHPGERVISNYEETT